MNLHTRNTSRRQMRRKICFWTSNFEITKREIMFSVIIALVMVVIGLFIGNAISNGISESNEQYYKALKITDADQFQYGLQTSVGNALVYGTVTAVEPVSMPEVNGEWFYIERVEERYTMHTRTVTTTVNGKTQTQTETYWTWDTVDREDKQTKKFSFMGVSFKNTLQGLTTEHVGFDLLSGNVLGNYIYDGGHIRYYFVAIPETFNATLEVKLKQNKIASWQDKESIMAKYEKSIPQVMDSVERKEETVGVIFWVIWCVLICAAVVGFCYLENRWIEDREE